MSIVVKHRRDDATNIDAAVLAEAEIGLDTTNKELRYGDGATQGGLALERRGRRPFVVPDEIDADQDDYAPTGHARAQIFRLTSDAARTITGLAGGADGRIVEVFNAGAQPLTLKDASSSSTAANRFSFGFDITLAPNQRVKLIYLATASRWYLMSGPHFTGTNLAPAEITANQNDYSPTGLAYARLLKLTSDAARTITGLAGGYEGRVIALRNEGGYDITLPSENAGSTDVNRFSFGETIVLKAKHTVVLEYDGTAERWRLGAGRHVTTELPWAFYLSGAISPAEITANQDDYSPTGLADATMLRLTSDNAREITGLAGGADGRTLALLNNGNFPITLKNASSSSTAANRFELSGDIVLAAKQSAVLWYDATDSRWKLLAAPQAGGGSVGRELLTGNRTYYVRADGNDSNNGLADSSGGAFLTVQKAIDIAAALDLGIYDVTIQVGAGTYTGALTLKSFVGAGKITILGDATTPSNVTISVTSATAVTQESVVGRWKLRGLKIQTTTSGHGIICRGSYMEIDAIDFGAIVSTQLNVARGATLVADGNYTISGGCSAHIIADSNSNVFINGRTITLSGTPNFSLYFCGAQGSGFVQAGGSTFSGSGTGVRYSATLNGTISVAGGGASYLPGNSAGSTATGGEYA